MKKQNKLNEVTLDKARKEKEKMLKLIEKVNKANKEINKIKEENRWMAYLPSDFCDEATENQQIEFFNNFKELR